MDNNATGKAALARDVAEFGGGGAVVVSDGGGVEGVVLPEGDGDGGGVAALGGGVAVGVEAGGGVAAGEGVGAAVVGGGVAVGEGAGVAVVGGGVAVGEGAGAAVVGGGDGAVVVPVTLMASCWPSVQWLGKVQVKKCSPAVVRVILAGLVVVRLMVVVVSHALYAAFVTSATLWDPLTKLNTRVSPIRKVLFAAQALYASVPLGSTFQPKLSPTT